VTVFGAVAVSTMVLAYAFEGRHAFFVGLFAAACAISSVYALVIGSIPFAVAEAVWCVVALGRLGRRARAGGIRIPGKPAAVRLERGR
jgi:hypothetical protein